MRNFQCYCYILNDKNILVLAPHTSCWSFLLTHKVNKNIYITNFDEPETLQYQELLIDVVNKITPCQITEIISPEITRNWHGPIPKKRCIEFKTLKTYDQSLILLNFIRNLWNQPNQYYSVKFFESLKKAKHDDPLSRLTLANKQACEECHEMLKKSPAKYDTMGMMYYSVDPGHSNYHGGVELKIKTVAQLKKYKGNNTRNFLTLDEAA